MGKGFPLGRNGQCGRPSTSWVFVAKLSSDIPCGVTDDRGDLYPVFRQGREALLETKRAEARAFL